MTKHVEVVGATMLRVDDVVVVAVAAVDVWYMMMDVALCDAVVVIVAAPDSMVDACPDTVEAISFCDAFFCVLAVNFV